MVRGKRGQATLFIILGIILIFIFVIAIRARSSIQEAKNQQAAEQAVSAYVGTANVEYYVRSCLQQVTDQALIDLGAHGGYLPEQFPSLTAGEDYLQFTDSTGTHKIGYALLPNDGCPDVFSTSPSYPRSNLVLADLPFWFENGACKSSKLYAGYFGIFSLPRLCSLTGPNTLSQSENLFGLACKSQHFAFNANITIQERLRQHIANNLTECLDFEFYHSELGHVIEINESAIDAVVTYAKDSIKVDGIIPFTVTLANGRDVKTSRDFTYTSTVRLKKIYEFLAQTLAQEAMYYDYLFLEDYQFSPDYVSGIEVTVQEDPCTFQPTDCAIDTFADDLLILKDEETYLDNKPYEFIVAIKNRRPALDYIHQNDLPLGADLWILEDENLTIDPQGYDPDAGIESGDETLTYHYSGWLQDNNETLVDMTCWTAVMATSSTDPADYYSCMTYQALDILDQDGDWEDSNLYQTTFRQAMHHVAIGTMGMHRVRVTVTDDALLDDFQDIYVLVADLPEAVASGNNFYNGIPDTYASKEDPYLLDGSASIDSIILGPIEEHVWSVSPEGYGGQEARWRINVETHPEYEGLILPIDLVTDPFITILPAPSPTWTDQFYIAAGDDITTQPFTKTVLPATPFTVTLSVMTGGSPGLSDTLDLTLFECLPYNGVPAANPPWPYTALTPVPTTYGTAYVGTNYNHICCSGTSTFPVTNTTTLPANWGQPASTSTTCFTNTLNNFGVYLRDNIPSSLYGSVQVVSVTPTITYQNTAGGALGGGITAPQYQNDPFTRTFTRKCDGDRGNTCTGAVDILIKQVDACNDFVTFLPSGAGSQVERCEEPNSGFTACQSVPAGQSFESRHSPYLKRDGVTPADGHCGANEICGSGDGALLGVTGDKLCWAGCSTAGTCSVLTDCACDVASCGADCDTANPFSYNDVTGMCSHSCNPASCTYATPTYCPEACVSNSATIPTCKTTGQHSLLADEYCFMKSDPCGATGCDYTGVSYVTLQQGFCDTCTPTGSYSGDRCWRGAYNGYCYWAPASVSLTCSGTTCTPLALGQMHRDPLGGCDCNGFFGLYNCP